MAFSSKSIELMSRIKAKFIRAILRFTGVRDSNIVSLNFGEIESEVRFSRGVKYSNILTVESIHARDQLSEVHGYGERFLYTVENIILDSTTGTVFTSSGRVIEESTSWPASNILLNSIPKPFSRGITDLSKIGKSFVCLPANGFYHWLLEDLAPFIFTIKHSNHSLVLVHEDVPSYVQSFLPTINADALRVPRFVRLDQYTFTSKGPDAGWPHAADISTLRSYFAPYLHEQEQGKKIYISRLDSSRSPEFEKELVSRLRAEGWDILNTERMSLTEQIEAISVASTIVGVHGAGLAGMIWMGSGSQVIELSPNRFVPCFSRMSQICGIGYHRIQFERPTLRNASEIIDEINEVERATGL